VLFRVFLYPKMMIRLLSLLLGLFLLLCSPMSAQSGQRASGEILTSLATGADGHFLAKKHGKSTRAELLAPSLGIWLFRSSVPETELLEWLRRQPEVREAQFNHLLEHRGSPLELLPNDPFFAQQWHLRNDGSTGGLVGADLEASLAWENSTGGLSAMGDTIVLAVIDRGIDQFHPDLAPNLWRNWAEMPNNGLDDDQNGFADDFRGWNVLSQNDFIQGVSSVHGTPVSAVMAAKGDNGIGGAGVNWDAKIMFVASLGTESHALAAFDYVLRARKLYQSSGGAKGAFVVALNCSWGINFGQPADAPLWCAAFDSLGKAGILTVAATANLPVNVDEVGDLPTAGPSDFLISVTSLNQWDVKATTAAWGSKHIDLGAFGDSISTAASGGGQGIFSGTSFAAPQVAGAIGLLYAAPCPNLSIMAKSDPEAAALWVRGLLLDNTVPNLSLEGKTASNGRLSLYRPLHAYKQQCGECPAPFALTASGIGENTALLQWAVMPSAVSTALRWREIGTDAWVTAPAVQEQFLLAGLTPCAQYEFAVKVACGSGDESPWSAPFAFQTSGCCAPPQQFWQTGNTEESISITWLPIGQAKSYKGQYRLSGSAQWQFFETPDNQATLTGLKPCNGYDVQVQSVCEGGFSDFSPSFDAKTKGCGACYEWAYCPASAASASKEWVASFRLGEWWHVSGTGGAGYQNFTSTQALIPVLSHMEPKTVEIVPGYLNVPSKVYCRIFVDYDHDGTFDGPDELAFDPGFASEEPVSGIIVVPSLAKEGITRLRVVMRFHKPNDPLPAPCGNFDFGQVEDYCVRISLDPSVPTSEPAPDMEALRLYPQPAREILWVKFPQHVDGETCNIRVFDPAGRLWLDQYLPVFADKTSQVSLSQWPSGLYFLQAKFSDGQFLGKFIRW
jgi:hypothetical protein